MEDSGLKSELKNNSESSESTPSTQETDIDALRVEIDDQEKIDQAEEFKKEGNEFFKNNDFQQAYDAYSKAVDVKVGGKKQ